MKKLLLYGEIPVNCYFIENNSKCYIVDPGYEKEKLIDYVKKHNLEVLGILLTHGHIDHIGAIDAFDVPVYLHDEEYKVITDNFNNGFEFYNRKKPYDLSNINLVKLKGNSVISLDDKKIEVIHTPGHTVGCLCYKFENDLYTGDTLFQGAVGKWTFPTGDLETLKKTVVSIIDTQEEDIRIHPAHGESSTIGSEKRHNQFYLMWKNDLN